MFQNLIPLFPGMPGGPELLIVLLVLVLLFGANKIPKLARSTGQAMGEFQRGRQEIEDELEKLENPPEADAEPNAERTTDASSSTEAATETSKSTDAAE
jgi:sec-independent protein translocase protein TatA